MTHAKNVKHAGTNIQKNQIHFTVNVDPFHQCSPGKVMNGGIMETADIIITIIEILLVLGIVYFLTK